MALVRAGYDPAFAELYRRYRPRVGAFVRQMVRDDGRAEDLTQDAFVAALRRMRETECEIVFRPWIYEIARNAAIDFHRRAGRAQELSFDGDECLPASDLLRYGATPGPDAIVIGRERFAHLRGALDELPDAHQTIIVLRELEGLSYREIGERMGLSDAAVESTLFRARRKLAHEYSQVGTGRRCASLAVAMQRLESGTASERDRAQVARHARCCAPCRRRAHALGVDPAPRRGSRAAALVPAFALARRKASAAATLGEAHNGAGAVGAVFAPAGPGLLAKAVSVLAAGALVAGGGATLGGVGPLAVHPSSVKAGAERHAAPAPRVRPQAPGTRVAPVDPRSRTLPNAQSPAPAGEVPGGAAETPAADAPGPALPDLPQVHVPVPVPEVKVPAVVVPPLRVPDVSVPPLELPGGLPALPAVKVPPIAGAAADRVEELRDRASTLLP